MRVPVAPHPHLPLELSVLWVFGHFNSSWFNLHFPDDRWYRTSLHMFIFHLHIVFGEVSVKIFRLSLNQVFLLLSFKKVLCIFYIIVLQMCLLKRFFSKSVTCLLSLLTLTSSKQKILNEWSPTYQFFAWIVPLLVFYLKKSAPYPSHIIWEQTQFYFFLNLYTFDFLLQSKCIN